MSDQMQKLTSEEGRSLDIVAENVARLRELFPEIVTEGKINFDALKEVLGDYVEDRDEFYNFTWNGKSRARQLAQTPSTGTLRPCKEESKDWDTTENLYIEGDNLEVLKLLQKSYFGKVKMIYIDPPYNTGKDFIYPDNFRDNIKNYLELTGQVDGEGQKLSTNAETSGRYHTDWLNMMYPRLKLARNLLREDGVIFISIDAAELENISKMGNEIFGENNRIGICAREMKKGANRGTHFSPAIDMLLCYAKNIIQLNNFFEPLSTEYLNSFNQDDHDGRGPYKTKNLYEPTLDYYPNCRYAVKCPDDTIVITPENKSFSHNKESFYRMLENNEIVFHNGKSSLLIQENGQSTLWTIKRKIFLSTMLQKGRRPSDLILNYINASGTKALNSLDLKFSFSKPVELLKYFCEIINEKEAIVLDFFSGSATTAHAVMQLNAEELTAAGDTDAQADLFTNASGASVSSVVPQKGRRKYIMVQLPEPCDPKSEAYKAGYKTIAEIGKERIRRAGEKIKQEFKDKPGIENLDTGFKVFKLDSSNIESWDPEFAAGDEAKLKKQLELGISNIKQGRSDEDLLYEILLKYGIDLTVPIRTVKAGKQTLHDVGMGALLLCLDATIETGVADAVVKLYKELDPEEPPRVVFRDSGFKDDAAKTNVMEQLSSAGIKEVRSV